MPAAPALVPRRLRLPVAERIRPDGTVEVQLDRTSLNSAIAVLKAEKVEAVAICFLHSWRDDAHERAAAEAVRTPMSL
jgi:N-methylhydantoinase A